MSERGHNNPPEMLELAKETTKSLSQWLAENPTATSEDEAREIKKQIDRAKLCLKDLEGERDGKVRPLNEQVAGINDRYRLVRKPLGTVLDQMLGVLDRYLQIEEDKRAKAAEEARIKALEAEERARELDRLEREKRDDAMQGEVGIDIAELTEAADAAFDEYTRAERSAIRAEADMHVKIGGGFGRSIGLRQTETLFLDDPIACIQDMGSSLPNNVKTSLLTAARAFRRLHDRLPNGVRAEISRSIAGKQNDTDD